MKFGVRPLAASVLTAALAATGGCASWSTPAERDESFSEAAGYERRQENTTRPFSVSDRGRSIEQDLGVR